MRARRTIAAALLTSTMLSTVPFALHAQAVKSGTSDTVEVVVTATKRSEKITNVPIAIQALTAKKLDNLDIANFDDFAAQLPSVTFAKQQAGITNVYMRGVNVGVSSGGDGNHSGPLPSVGVYLDEAPVTTIGGAVDVHIYDIARIESLEGPQGTLYGASSEAGTIRIITNKPDTSALYGRVDVEGNSVDHGGNGGKVEAMLNVPLSDKMAARFVGWSEHDAGYIDNVYGTRSFLGGLTVDNTPYVKNNENGSDITGGRAALKIDLDDNWTVNGSVIAQDQKSTGAFGYDPLVGDLKVQHFFPEFYHDRFAQAALTIQGKIGNLDLTYAGAYMDRKIDSQADYTDYAEAYDQLYASVGGVAGYFYFSDNNGNPISSQQKIVGKDHFTKYSHELRLASPVSDRLRWVGGLFYQQQTHLIHQDYQVAGLADNMSVNGSPGTLWLTQQNRVDKDYAAFGELSFDITPKWTITAGGRAFGYDNTLIGFFGFGRDPNGPPWNAAGSSHTGVIQCYTTTGDTLRDNPTGTALPATVSGSPCTNLATVNSDGTLSPKEAKDTGFSYKLNLAYKPMDGALYYATYSRGFRPGGINRRGTIPPYAADYLDNLEFGFKHSFLDKSLYINGAIYAQDWHKFQFAFLGPNSFTEVHNGPDARIYGLELDTTWTPIHGLTLNASGAFNDAKTKSNLCLLEGDTTADCSAVVIGTQDIIAAPKGTRLPITPQVKVAGNARYTWTTGNLNPYVQLAFTHQSKAASDLRTAIYQTFTGIIINPAMLAGDLKPFTTFDLSAGSDFGRATIEVFVRN
ncbi:MAG: TonB-dependent receptor, partial [Asticcacaulis sp.]